MRRVNTEPTEGQFVVMWTYNNEVWAETCKIIEGIRYTYNDMEGDFILEDSEWPDVPLSFYVM